MTQKIMSATNVHRPILFQGGMAVDVDSHIADFKEMSIGSVQAWWMGNDGNGGMIQVLVSNFPEASTFAPLPDSLASMDTDRKSILWNIGVLGFRYAFVRYTANGVTEGTLHISALAKKA